MGACVSSGNHATTAGGKIARTELHAGHVESKALLSNPKRMEEMKKAIYGLINGDTKAIAALRTSNAAVNMEFQKKVFMDVWAHYLRKEDKDQQAQGHLPVDSAKQALSDYIDATYDYAVQLRSEIYHAEWSLLKAVFKANGAAAKAFTKDGGKLFKKVKKNTALFFKMYDAPEGFIDGQAGDWKLVSVKQADPTLKGEEKGNPAFIDKATAEDVWTNFSKTELYKVCEIHFISTFIVYF